MCADQEVRIMWLWMQSKMQSKMQLYGWWPYYSAFQKMFNEYVVNDLKLSLKSVLNFRTFKMSWNLVEF